MRYRLQIQIDGIYPDREAAYSAFLHVSGSVMSDAIDVYCQLQLQACA